MSDADDDLLSRRFGRRTVAENLDRAVEAGHAERTQDGALRIKSRRGSDGYTMYSGVPWPHPCSKLLFLFDHVYDRSQVPWTCRNCHKVKARPRTLSELVAVHDAAVKKPYTSKFRPEAHCVYSADLYGGFFYANGLEQARSIYKDVRASLDAVERLRDVPLQIKRGCTEYEVHCGPSDRYAFPPDLERVEARLLPLLTVTPQPRSDVPRSIVLAQWIRTAFQVGDESYLELTGGRPLYPKTVSYDP